MSPDEAPFTDHYIDDLDVQLFCDDLTLCTGIYTGQWTGSLVHFIVKFVDGTHESVFKLA